ncbi:hypothetical protein JKY79_03425 [Candidatus Babeliales bacterium]|nr:hypothetical protein [Candidatus Babeliales bacterium]
MKPRFLFIFLCTLIPYIHATSSPKIHSPARFIKTLGNIEDCCSSIEKLFKKYATQLGFKRKTRSNSFLDNKTSCPIYEAVVQKRLGITTLFRTNLETNKICTHQRTALHAACLLFNEIEPPYKTAIYLKYLIIKGLLILGFDPTMKDRLNKTPIDCMNSSPHSKGLWYQKTINLLSNSGAEESIINQKNSVANIMLL